MWGHPRGGVANFLDRIYTAQRYAVFNSVVTTLIGVALFHLSTETPGPVLPRVISWEVATIVAAVFLGAQSIAIAAVIVAHQRLRATVAPHWVTVAPGPVPETATQSGSFPTADSPAYREEALIPAGAQRRFVMALLLSQILSAGLLTAWSGLLGLERNTIVLVQVGISTVKSMYLYIFKLCWRTYERLSNLVHV